MKAWQTSRTVPVFLILIVRHQHGLAPTMWRHGATNHIADEHVYYACEHFQVHPISPESILLPKYVPNGSIPESGVDDVGGSIQLILFKPFRIASDSRPLHQDPPSFPLVALLLSTQTLTRHRHSRPLQARVRVRCGCTRTFCLCESMKGTRLKGA